jgi:DNA-directed RNA polymerase specialized sigma24 family protein
VKTNFIATATRCTNAIQDSLTAGRVDLMDLDDFPAQPVPKAKAELPNPPNWCPVAGSRPGRGGLHGALRQTRSWRVPPNWSSADWFAESRQIGEAAAWKATADYDSAYGLPLERFIYQRVMTSVLTQYRRERRFGFRFGSRGASPEHANDRISQSGEPFSDATAPQCECGLYQDVKEAIEALPDPTGWLLVQIFWYGYTETEIADVLGLSQRAICKRKHVGLRNLRELLSLQFHS